jgi:hypothetical protein
MQSKASLGIAESSQFQQGILIKESRKLWLVFDEGGQSSSQPPADVEPKLMSADPTSPVFLGDAGNYAILAKSGISTVPTSAITGNIAVSPIAATAITGFGLTLDSGGQHSTASQVMGQVHAASYGGETAAALTAAVGDMETAYTDAASRTTADAERINLGGGILGGDFGGAEAPLTPGVYTFGTGVTISDTIFFQGTGTGVGQGETDVFIIQMTGNLRQDANINVQLTGGASARNIFWQVAGNVNLMAGAHMEGILLVKTDVTFVTSSSLTGSILAQTAVNLQMATITQVCNTARTGVDCCGSDCNESNGLVPTSNWAKTLGGGRE